MEERTNGKHTVILAGVGGSGVVWNGTLLARAGLRKYEYVTRLPNFTTAMRGGPCECMVVLSDNKIACPLVGKGDALIILDNSQLKPFEGRVRPGGVIILESTTLKAKVERGDVKVIEIPAVEVASRIGDPMVSGTVLIGAYAEATKTIPADFIEKELEVRFGIAETGVRASEKEILLSHNMEALKQGMALIAK